MLTKQLITSGDYLMNFGHVPDGILWTLERIEQSMHDTLKQRPHQGDFWVFGYGSLLWNPLLSFVGQQRATLHGWHRSFCLRMIAGRASLEVPGRMLALEPGGSTQGLAYRLTEEVADEELILLWVREMPTGAYRPVWTEVELADGRKVMALVFVAEPAHPLYERDSTVAAIARCIARAEGPMGSNADYVHRLCAALHEREMADGYITALSAEIMF
ncbi:gamma-glutamylcyclotransferase [Pseudomonas sp. NPDC090202]|uniref:gamma-glutamylcyclotransferase n=1 Tax=unclassified Pseudomonas TaxID=196821 RepID=UPI00380A9066